MNNLNLYTYMKKLILLTILAIPAVAHAQSDTIFINNQRIIASVKEITPDAVKYTLPGEDLINSVYKNTVQKIAFKNGRVQTFSESTSLKLVKAVTDYENVAITSVEGEIRGLYKLTDVNSKAKGTTVYSNQEKVKERAYKKLKIQAAMFGANIVYLSAQRTEGNKYGSYFTSGSTAETNLTGIAYSSVLPNSDQFKTLVGTKSVFTAVKGYRLRASDSDLTDYDLKSLVTVKNITNENGIIIIEADIKGQSSLSKFQLASFNDKTFTLACKDEGTAYSFVVEL